MKNINKNIQILQELNSKLTKELYYYIKNKTNEEFQTSILEGDYEEEVIEGESILDCLQENIERNNSILEIYDEIMKKQNKQSNILKEMKRMIHERNANNYRLKKSIENILKIIKKEEQKEINLYQQEINEIQNKCFTFTKSFNNYLFQCNLKTSQINKLEEWTQLTFDTILFDSRKDKNNQKINELTDLLVNKKNLLFIFKLEEENICCGCFISNYIQNPWLFVNDKNAFLFSFQKNQHLKFSIKNHMKNYAFKLFDFCEPNYLFQIGFSDISVGKKLDCIEILQTWDNSFDYEGKENGLTGKKELIYSLKQTIIVQMK